MENPVRALRQELSMTQTSMAAALHVNHSQIERLEAGRYQRLTPTLMLALYAAGFTRDRVERLRADYEQWLTEHFNQDSARVSEFASAA